MARQKSIVKLKGTLGDLALYKSRDGHLAREKGGINGDRIKNDAAFQRTRENNVEFKEAARAMSLLQRAFREVLVGIYPRAYRGRLMQEMLKILRTDTVNVRGERKVHNENIELLRGFEFNAHCSFSKVFKASYGIQLYEFEENVWYVEYYTFPAFAPARVIAAPPGATHFRLMSGGGQIDFEKEIYTIETKPDMELPLNDDLAALASVYEIDHESNLPVFMIFRPLFYQMLNGRLYELKGNSYNAATLVFVKRNVEYSEQTG